MPTMDQMGGTTAMLAALADETAAHTEADKGQALESAASELIIAAYRVADVTNKMATAVKEFRGIQTKILPPIMDEMGIPEKKIYDPVSGVPLTIRVADYILPSYVVEDRERVNDWFVSIGQGAVVKRQIVVELPNGDDDYPERIRQAIAAVLPGAPMKLNRSIHYQTFKSSISTRHVAGRDIPEFIKVYAGREAKLPNGILPTKEARVAAAGGGSESQG